MVIGADEEFVQLFPPNRMMPRLLFLVVDSINTPTSTDASQSAAIEPLSTELDTILVSLGAYNQYLYEHP